MTVSQFITIWCDWPDCLARIETSRTRISEARKHAREVGWRSIANLIDLCGSQEGSYERHFFTRDIESWSNHGGRTDHLPVIKPANKGEVYVSCTCGWGAVPRYSWERPGIAPRTSADFRWREHIKGIFEKEQGQS